VKASENAEKATYAEKSGKGIPDGVLTEEEIMGNSFIFIFAGHETSAGTLHYAMIHLAMHPTIQAHLQSDIDNIVGSRPSSEWSYTVDLRNLYNSMVGAVLNETLRVTPVVVRSPKINRGGPKQLTIDGRTVTLPGNNTYIHLDIVGTNYNPRHFPTSPSKITPGKTDIAEFIPERWLTNKASGTVNSNGNGNGHSNKAAPIDGLENASFEAAGSLFRPAKGAFIAFADGARACPGRRFVQVEITGVLAVIFSQYSVELDVRDLVTDKYPNGVSDEELLVMGVQETRAVYERAKERAWGLVRGAVPTISLKMEGEGVPLRFVRRGRERFGGLGI
jgi:cytochrome P450